MKKTDIVPKERIQFNSIVTAHLGICCKFTHVKSRWNRQKLEHKFERKNHSEKFRNIARPSVVAVIRGYRLIRRIVFYAKWIETMNANRSNKLEMEQNTDRSKLDMLIDEVLIETVSKN